MYVDGSLDDSGTDGLFHRLILSLENPEDALKRIGAYKRASVKRLIENGEFPALDPETLKRKMTMGKLELLSTVRGVGPRGSSRLRREGVLKLVDQAARAKVKAEQAAERAANAGAIKASVRAGLGDYGRARKHNERAAVAAEKARQKWLDKAATREKALRDVVRLFGGAAGIKSVKELIDFAEHDLAKRKAHKEGFGRGPRERADERSTKRLGAMPDTIVFTAKARSVVIGSRWDKSEIHNEGGTAGNGAEIDACHFMEILPEDIEEAAKIISEELAKAIERE